MSKAPTVKLEVIPSKCVVDEDGCRRNVLAALRRGLRIAGWAPKRTGQLAIVGAGPSVLDHVDEIRDWPGEIWAINGAYRFLLERGIVPHAFVGLDPQPELAEYVEIRDARTAFLISSVCDPAVVDELEKTKTDIMLWHSKQDVLPYPEGSAIVSGGTTCATRTPYLAYMLGWRDMTVFGADSSYSGGRAYCYDNVFGKDTLTPGSEVEVNGQVFVSVLTLLKQVSVFGVMQTLFGDKLKFRTGGLLGAFLESPIEQDPEAWAQRTLETRFEQR